MVCLYISVRFELGIYLGVVYIFIINLKFKDLVICICIYDICKKKKKRVKKIVKNKVIVFLVCNIYMKKLISFI